MSKQELMAEIAKEIAECKKCELWKSRKNVVPGEGNVDADVMFIGEAPGYWEDVKGRPFVGAAGKLLDKLLENIGLSRNEVFIGNILKCRPPQNRDPRPDEIEACTPYLDRQIRVIQPKIMVTLGRHSTAYIFNKVGLKFYGISKLHGRIYEVTVLDLPVVLIPMYHPAVALYNARLKDDLKMDFEVLRNVLSERVF